MLTQKEKEKAITPKKAFLKRFGKKIDEYSSFQRATEGLKLQTVKGYRSVLSRFFVYLDEDPDTVIANRQQDVTCIDMLNINRYERKVTSYIKIVEMEGFVSVVFLNRIQGFFTNNSKRLSLDLGKLDVSDESKRTKYSPTVDEVKRLLSFANSSRDKFIVTLAFQNGVLPVDIVGLKIGEYPTEPWVYYKKQRSKTKKTWHGVSTPDIVMFLKDYLVVRNGKEKEPLLLGRFGPMTADAVKFMLQELIVRAGFDSNPNFIPKCLRDGFEDILVDADVYTKTKEAMMGHCGAIAHSYGDAKKLEKRVVEAMTTIYPYISLTGQNNVVNSVGITDQELIKIAKILPIWEKIAEHYKNDELFIIKDKGIRDRLRGEGLIS